MGKMTDKAWILAQLKTGRKLTTWDCIVERGCTRAPARINELRREGYNITTTMRSGTDRNGEPCFYGVYELRGAGT